MSKSHPHGRRNILRQCIAGLLVAGAWSAASAQNYPDRTIHLVVPFAAGGPVDIVARIMGEELSQRLGQSVVVENRTGAGGNIGASYVAQANPDGYTLLMGSTGNSVKVSYHPKGTPNPNTELMPVARVGQIPMVLVAPSKLTLSNLGDIKRQAQAKPENLSIAHGGAGTLEHLAAEMLNQSMGTEFPIVGYRGGGPAINDVIGGHVQLYFTPQSNALPHIEAGTLKPLALTSAKRSALLPDTPTFIEQGHADFMASVWWGIFGPKGLPQDVATKVNQAINDALASASVKGRLASFGASPAPGSVSDFAAFFSSEVDKWASVVKAAGMELE